MSKIEWTELTLNPLVGCTIASTGCAGCYAIAECYRKMFHPNEKVAKKFEGTVRKTGAGQLVWTGRINYDETAAVAPLKRRAPTTYFVNSLSDLFHENVAFDIIDRIFAVFAMTPHHRYQILTKRADRMAEYFEGNWRARVSEIVNKWPEDEIGHGNEFLADWNLAHKRFLPNVALGTSVENQDAAWRIEHLRYIPAAVRFLSCEPLVGALDIRGFLPDLDWVIVGGESGPKARPWHPNWVRKIRDDCAEFEHVAFFYKQHGNWAPVEMDPADWEPMPDANLREGKVTILPNGAFMGRGFFPMDAKNAAQMDKMPKKLAGRVLDGETHDAMPRWDR